MTFIPYAEDDQLLDLTPDLPPIRLAFIWMQNNAPSKELTPRDPSATVMEYDWNSTAITAYNYVATKVRYRDASYTGTAGEAATFVDATTSDTNVVKLRDGSGNTSNSATVTSIPGNGQFDTVGKGSAKITYRYRHPLDASVIISAILYVTIP